MQRMACSHHSGDGQRCGASSDDPERDRARGRFAGELFTAIDEGGCAAGDAEIIDGRSYLGCRSVTQSGERPTSPVSGGAVAGSSDHSNCGELSRARAVARSIPLTEGKRLTSVWGRKRAPVNWSI